MNGIHPARRGAGLRWALLALGLGALGVGYQWSGDQRLQRADLEQLQEVTQREPRHGLAHYYLGLRLAEQGRAVAAVAELRQAAALSPRDPRPAEALLGTLLAQGQTTEARAELARVQAAWPQSAVVWLSQGRLAYQEHDYLAALEAFRKVTELAPRERRGWYALGRSLRELRRGDEARAAFRRALELDPQHPDTLAMLGRCEIDAGENGEALRVLRRALAVNPEHAATNRYLAEVLCQQQPADAAMLAEAKDAALRAVRAMPGMGPAWFWLAKIYHRTGQTDQAMGALQWALNLEPRDESTLQLLCELLVKTGSKAESSALRARLHRVHALNVELAQLERQSQQTPAAAEPHLRMARLQARAALWAAAVREYEAGLRLSPGNATVQREYDAARARVPKRRRVAPDLEL